MSKNKIDPDKHEEMIRNNNPKCDNTGCTLGDFQVLKSSNATVMCLGCMISDNRKYGQLAIMPKGFVIPE